jgi:hypothetical protein
MSDFEVAEVATCRSDPEVVHESDRWRVAADGAHAFALIGADATAYNSLPTVAFPRMTPP